LSGSWARSVGEPGQHVERAWLARHPVAVAWRLIGCELTLTRDGVTVGGRIVEAEAYAGPADPASHASRLRVAKAAMAAPPGSVYTYLSYGIHRMMNIVAHEEGQSGGVLLRALVPTEGIEAMRERRGVDAIERLARGPGSLGQAMGIRLTDLGADLLGDTGFCLRHGEPHQPVFAGPRIGISRNVEAPWRFFEHPSRFVSANRRGERVDEADLSRLIPSTAEETSAFGYPQP
jgi:DNA-3-methyladenine glycosylase